MSIIYFFVLETPDVKYLWLKKMFFSHSFIFLQQKCQDKIFHKFMSEHPIVIEGMQRLIFMEVLDPEEAYDDVIVGDDGAASDEED